MAKKRRKKKRGINIFIVLAICLGMMGGTYFYTMNAIEKETYRGSSVAYSRNLIKNLDVNSAEYKKAQKYYTEEELSSIREGIDLSKVVTESETIDEQGLELIKIHGSTYQAFLLLIHHPEDVIVAINPTLDSAAAGMYLEEYCEAYNAVAGINAGGFEDAGGNGNGGQAWGIVIHEGKLVSGSMNEFTSVIGINGANRLVVGDMTAAQALEWDVQEAVTFGPIFIKEFQNVFTTGPHPMLNPRTVIGQREDGTFMFLVIDGRQPISFGSTYQDIIDIMSSYGAMMAANLDGGNSTIMYYNGEVINSTVSIKGGRHLPTAFLVKEHQ
ncbi:MAG: phosphodiester glycosidase family protein [Erysipelotrichaceae bacterium]|nr:phosphodiester glycosidase family protein [Erysipelotrichaceae bacterium]